MYVAVEVVNL